MEFDYDDVRSLYTALDEIAERRNVEVNAATVVRFCQSLKVKPRSVFPDNSRRHEWLISTLDWRIWKHNENLIVFCALSECSPDAMVQYGIVFSERVTLVGRWSHKKYFLFYVHYLILFNKNLQKGKECLRLGVGLSEYNCYSQIQ